MVPSSWICRLVLGLPISVERTLVLEALSSHSFPLSGPQFPLCKMKWSLSSFPAISKSYEFYVFEIKLNGKQNQKNNTHDDCYYINDKNTKAACVIVVTHLHPPGEDEETHVPPPFLREVEDYGCRILHTLSDVVAVSLGFA